MKIDCYRYVQFFQENHKDCELLTRRTSIPAWIHSEALSYVDNSEFTVMVMKNYADMFCQKWLISNRSQLQMKKISFLC